MSALRDATATSRTLAGASVRDAANVLRSASIVQVRDAGGLHSVLDGNSGLSASPQYVSGAGYSKASILVTTDTTSVTAPAGSTFAWSFDDTGWTATNPTSANTAFSHRCAPGGDFETNATCTVTISGRAYNVIVDAEVTNTYGGLE